nr:MAG TPA: hypothetical protein [Caudoviricetes sp.]
MRTLFTAALYIFAIEVIIANWYLLALYRYSCVYSVSII